MDNFYFILFSVIVPIFIQVAIGFGIQKIIRIDVKTLSKIQLYYFVPAYLFLKIATLEIDSGFIIKFFGISAALMLISTLLALLVSSSLKYSKTMKAAFLNSNIFYNSGNLCIPLINLLCTAQIAITAQLCVLIFQNITTNTIGIVNAAKGRSSLAKAIISVFKLPMVYALTGGFLINYFNIEIWNPLHNALDMAGQGLVPAALFTLGAQLANTKFNFRLKAPILASFMRLIIGPVIAFGLIKITGMTGIPAQVFVICASAPTAVNTALLAVEFNNEPDFASQTVLIATLLSTFTLTGSIYLAMNYL